MSRPRMLVALQPEEGATRRIEAAAAWAKRFGAVLDLATVVHPRLTLDPLLGADATRDEATAGLTVHQNASSWLDGLLPAIPAEQRGTARVLTGSPSEVLVEQSAAYDVLVVGTHHRTDIARLFLGSVAENVVRSAHCSVLVLGDSASLPPRTGPIGVRVPVDVSEPDPIALNWLAKHVDADITAVYVLPWMTVFGPTPGDGDELYANAMRALRNALTSIGHAETDPVVLIRSEMAVGDALAHEATESNAHLIAMPTHSRGGVARAILGSVAERTVRAATVPVLVVR